MLWLYYLGSKPLFCMHIIIVHSVSWFQAGACNIFISDTIDDLGWVSLVVNEFQLECPKEILPEWLNIQVICLVIPL